MERLLQATTDDAGAVELHLASLSITEVEELLLSLPRHENDDAAMPFVRIVFGSPVDGQVLSSASFYASAARRHKAMDILLLLVLEKKLHHKWVNELCMVYMVLVDELRVDATAMAAVLKEVLAVLDTILRLLATALRAPTVDGPSFQSILDSIPYLVSLAKPASTSELGDSLLALPWTTPTLHLVLDFVKGTSFLGRRHHVALQTLAREALPSLPQQLAFGYWNDCIQACFELSDIHDDTEWVLICRAMLEQLPAALERDLDYLVQTLFQYSPVLVGRFHESLVARPPRSPTDVLVLLHALQAAQPLFKLAIDQPTSRHRQLQDVLLAHLAAQPVVDARPLLRYAAHCKALVLLDAAVEWLQTAPRVASPVLLALFDDVPDLRAEVVDVVLAAMERDTPAALDVVTVLAADRTQLLAPLGQQIQERVGHVFGASVAAGSALLERLFPLVASAAFYGFVMVFLRKQLVSPLEAPPGASIALWCTLLASPLLSARQQEDVLTVCHDVLLMPHVALKVHLLRRLPPALPALPAALLLPLADACKGCLSAVASVDADGGLALRNDVESDQAGLLVELCIELLPRLSPAAAYRVQQLCAALAGELSHAHCVAFVTQPPASVAVVAARVGLYESLCRVAGLADSSLRCTLGRIAGHVPEAELLDALELTGCCLQRAMLALCALEKAAADLSSNTTARALAATARLYPELVQGLHDARVAHNDGGLVVACGLKPLKVFKATDVMAQVLRVWIAVAKTNGHFAWPAFLAHWGVSAWEPVLAAFLEQLQRLLGGASTVYLALVIAEWLQLVQTQLPVAARADLADAVYATVCENAVGSPNLLRALLGIALQDAPLERLIAVLREAQAQPRAPAVGKFKRLRAAVAHPLLVSDTTRTTAYVAAMKQVDGALQCWYTALGAGEPSSPWSRVHAALLEAFIEPELAWKAAGGVLDSVLRVGKGVLPALLGGAAFVGIVHDVVALCLALVAAWQHGTATTVNLTTKIDVFLLETAAVLTAALRKKHALGPQEREMIEAMARRIMAHVEAMSEMTKKQTKQLQQQAQELRAQTKQRRKHRLRSRHEYIDECLREEGGDDAFADLEDFIA
ncbi:hypothetical protein ACHHYP_00931 [Achlya hypogyna]|uniref:Uncharacterized protein n=1 Tax=Achlya hypogyna TaxID=1202772 RepID=A0A1V9Z9S9_ACHHY|nr:hypothetical protein ACHHYP_00931 [Achlya hypogyna]